MPTPEFQEMMAEVVEQPTVTPRSSPAEAASPSSPVAPEQPEWKTALALPGTVRAPEALKTHIRDELRLLFMLGRKKVFKETTFETLIEPLKLDGATVKYSKKLLEHLNYMGYALEKGEDGKPIPLPLKLSAPEIKRLHSIKWDEDYDL